MTTTAEVAEHPWQRLGALLAQRRRELGYRRVAPFVRAHNLSHRKTIDDLERARRDNYSPATLAHVELIYGWQPGSIAAVLAGLPPAAITGPVPAPRLVSDADAALRRRIVDILDLPISDSAKLGVIAELARG